MRELAPHPSEALLRLCEASAPKPWFPRVDGRPGGMSQDQMYHHLEKLWMDGLVQKARGTPETGPGLVLTPAGRKVLDDPEALRQLRDGQEVVTGDWGALVRKALSRPIRPYAAIALVGLNVVAFLLQGTYEKWWTLSGDDLLRGEWWRIATCCFVHFGPIHLLMNMVALFRLGQVNEQWWGPSRFLVLYALSGLGGSCLAVAMQPLPTLGGASGAICGLFGGIAVFILCNRRHLPRDFIRTWQTNLLINGVLLVAISFVPHVSYWAHLGGAVTGAAVAAVMQVQRFGQAPWRWVVLLALVPLPWLGYFVIDHQRATDKDWALLKQAPHAPNARPKDEQAKDDQGDPKEPEKEPEDFQHQYEHRMIVAMNAAMHLLDDDAAPLLDLPPDKRDPAEVERVNKALFVRAGALRDLADELAKAGPSDDPKQERIRQTALAYARARAALLQLAEERLNKGGKWSDDDEGKRDEVKGLRTEWDRARK